MLPVEALDRTHNGILRYDKDVNGVHGKYLPVSDGANCRQENGYRSPAFRFFGV